MPPHNWTNRVNGRNAPPDLQDIRNAARELSQEAGQTKGRTGIVFQNVAQVTILGTVLVSGALAFLHLWKELSRERAKTHSGYRGPKEAADTDHPRRRFETQDTGHGR